VVKILVFKVSHAILRLLPNHFVKETRNEEDYVLFVQCHPRTEHVVERLRASSHRRTDQSR
jgi:hypothetical protein